ncbi:glycosyltransferase family 2 protein [Nitrosophilus kaiyonis]|uniref:glycosyltransferase family 2 protein n=1 Tax=Nitrosophilus kaiyonis TaxID=2930200 RepID=UPI00249362C6|nr:glycosyltransferase family 2 protein [Nitrosophilus kaiyonis]
MNISAAVIVKNEEKNLPRLLDSLKDKFVEIIVVDTGSTDKTIEIAKSYGCEVYEHKWNGFADARNFAISKCKGDWIWHFDADFELEEEEYEKFRKVFPLLNNGKNIKVISTYIKNFGKDGNVKSISTQAFLHRKSNDIFWTGNIHEVLNVKESYAIDLFINHYGYEDLKTQIEKAKRNLELIYKDLSIYPKDSKEYFIKLFYLFQTYAILGSFEKKYIEKGINKIVEVENLLDKNENKLNNFFSIYIFVYIADLFIKKEDFKKALFYVDKGLNKKDDFPDLLYMKGYIYENLKDYKNEKIFYLEFLKSVDYFEKNPIDEKNNTAMVIDKLVNIPTILDDKLPKILNEKDLDSIKKEWKKSKNRYFAYLLLKLYEKYLPQKLESLIKKVVKIHEFYLLFNFAARYYLEKENFFEALKYAKKSINLNKKDQTANEIAGISSYNLKNYLESVKYFKNLNIENIKKTDLLLFIDALKKVGFQKEAEKIEKKLKIF